MTISDKLSKFSLLNYHNQLLGNKELKFLLMDNEDISESVAYKLRDKYLGSNWLACNKDLENYLAVSKMLNQDKNFLGELAKKLNMKLSIYQDIEVDSHNHSNVGVVVFNQ